MSDFSNSGGSHQQMYDYKRIKKKANFLVML